MDIRFDVDPDTGLPHILGHGVTEVTGRGLLIGVQLAREVGPQVVAAAQAAGFIVNATGPSRLRLAPPLILTEDDARAFGDAWPGILETAQETAQA